MEYQLTATRYGKTLAAGASLQIPYNFYSEYAPGEHGLTVFVDLLVDVSKSFCILAIEQKEKKVNGI